MKTTQTFRKGKVYSPDVLNDLPMDTNRYFDEGDEFAMHNSKYEYGSCRCIKSFKITIEIKEL